MENVLILGSGPAGATAALYCARANLDPLVVEGSDAGGQLLTTTEIENFPGFPEGLAGPDLVERIRKQAENFGARFKNGEAVGADYRGLPLKTTLPGQEVLKSRTVIIATGPGV
jgi:thioredoxin reductase (NADPH)